MFKKIISMVILSAMVIMQTNALCFAAEQKGALAKWTFDNIDENIVKDEGAYHIDGEIINEATLVPGYIGYGMDFMNKSQDAVSLGKGVLNEQLSGAEAVSIGTWVKFNGLESGTQYIINTKIAGKSSGIELYASGDALRVAVRGSKEDKWTASVYEYPKTNAWYYLALVINFKEKTVDLYLDGQLQTPTTKGAFAFINDTFTPEATDAIDCIGGADKNTSRFNGVLDEFAIYKYALSEAEITELAQQAPTTKDDGLFLRYNCNQSQTFARDSSGKSSNGTFNKNVDFTNDGYSQKGILIPGSETDVNSISLPANTIGKNINGKSAMTFSAYLKPMGTAANKFYRLLNVYGDKKSSFMEFTFCPVKVDGQNVNGIRVVAKDCATAKWAYNFYPYDYINEKNSQWVNLSIIIDFENAKVKLFTDGNEVQPVIENINSTTFVNGGTYKQGNATLPDLFGSIGRATASESSFDGVIDNVYLYNRALTQDEINNLVDAKLNTECVFENAGNDVTAKITFKNNTPETKSVTGILAKYGAKLNDVKMLDKKIYNNDTQTISLTLTKEEQEILKAFVWDGDIRMKPLTNAFINGGNK